MEKASQRRGFRPTISPRVGELCFKSPPISPLCPHGGRWGKTLIGALVRDQDTLIVQSP